MPSPAPVLLFSAGRLAASTCLCLIAGCVCLIGGYAHDATAADSAGSSATPSTSSATSITPDQAGDMVSKGNGTITLDSLKSLSPAAAMKLAANEGGLSLDGLPSLDPDVALALSLHGRLEGIDPDAIDAAVILPELGGLFTAGGDGDVDVDGLLDGIDALVAGLPTAAKDGDGDAPGTSDPWLSLGGLKTITPGVAEALAMHDGPLLLDGLTEISPDVARALATHTGELSLAGLASLSTDSRAALAAHDGPVVLPDALIAAPAGG